MLFNTSFLQHQYVKYTSNSACTRGDIDDAVAVDEIKKIIAEKAGESI